MKKICLLGGVGGLFFFSFFSLIDRSLRVPMGKPAKRVTDWSEGLGSIIKQEKSRTQNANENQLVAARHLHQILFFLHVSSGFPLSAQ